MRKEIRGRSNSAVQQQTKSRKEMRKEKKEAKKQRIRHHFKNQPLKNHSNAPKTKPIMKAHPQPQSQQPNVQKKQKEKKNKMKKEENQDDKMIQLYQEKLGINAGKDKYGKIAKKYGFDDDIFDFLDGITNKVNADPQQQDEQELNDENEDFVEENQEEMEEEDDAIHEEGEQVPEQEFDEEYDRMFDNLDGEQYQMNEQDAQEGQEEQQDEENQEEQPQKQESQQEQPQKQEQRLVYRNPFQKKGDLPATVEQKEVRRAMNGLFNKLSDGNILLTFREFVKIIQSHPRSLTIPIFCELFTRFNLLIEKPLFHILATNVALSAGLHCAFGNRLMAPLLHNLTSKFLLLSSEKEDEDEVLEFGYSKRFERLKNYATMISLLYNYGSITGDYLQSFVQWLAQSLNKNTIELLYIIIQKCGVRVRQNDPSALKNIINIVKEAITRFRVQHSEGEELQKINFIELELTQIKFNKKAQTNADQRMAFLQTFILKNVPKEIQNQKEIFMLKFQELINIDTSRTNWWLKEEGGNALFEREGEEGQQEEYNEVAGEKRRLLDLAKSFHMVTQIKKNIFLCLMDSKDYLEATQRILDLRIKNYQDVATVLVQVCTLEPSFNPYYPLVAAKLASVMPKFRLNLQYAIWDHLKLIHQYELRRTANLAKFAGKLISDPLSNTSLSILKFFPDLSNIRAIDTTFLNIFFGYFFKKVKREYLSKLTGKLREDNNRSVKQGIKEYLSQFEPEQSLKEKVKLCRRLLLLELDQRKMQRGDDE